MGNYISPQEFAKFKTFSMKQKADCMTLYLIDGYGNMDEVGDAVFGKEHGSFEVSLIHRCYNFNEQNGGRYRKGCRFEQQYGYEVTRKDIEGFLKKYPKGTNKTDVTFEDYLLETVSRQKPRPAPTPQAASWSAAAPSPYPSQPSRTRRSPKGLLKAVVLIFVAFLVLKSCAGGVSGFHFSLPNPFGLWTSSEPEVFRYNGAEYTGYKKGKKPQDLCMRLDSDMVYEIGNYKSGALSGYGLRRNNGSIEMGSFKKGKLKGIGVITDSDGMLFGKIKNGKLSGYGVRYADGKLTIVKSSWSKIKEIAVQDGSGGWLKSGSAKPLKVKDNTYKGMRFEGSSVEIKGTTVSFSGYEPQYYNDETSMSVTISSGSASFKKKNADGETEKTLIYVPDSAITIETYKSSASNEVYRRELK